MIKVYKKNGEYFLQIDHVGYNEALVRSTFRRLDELFIENQKLKEELSHLRSILANED